MLSTLTSLALSVSCAMAQPGVTASSQLCHTGATFSHTAPAEEPADNAPRVDGEEMLDLRIHLGLRDPLALDQLLREQRDPKHANYKKFVTPQEFHARFGPFNDQFENARRVLSANGAILDPRAHGSTLHARIKASQAENIFKTTLHHVSTPEGQKRVHKGELSSPYGTAIIGVHGFVTAPRRTRHVQHHSAETGYTGMMTREAYNVPSTALGKGMTIGVIELDGYDPKDLAAYAHANGIRAVPTRNILLDGYDGKVQDKGAQVEVTMDIELINAMVPQAQEIRVYAAANSPTAFFDLWNEIANPSLGDKKLVKYISCSWGSPEDSMGASDLASEQAIFKQMAAQGQTVFSAAGDSGATDDGTHIGTDDPASQPYVVGVGGTSLYTQADNSYGKETAWSNGGGGQSCYFTAPPWQKGILSAASRGSLTMRNVPDISINADPATGHLVYVAGQWQVVGGTSCAAPLWTGIMALIDEARAHAKLTPVGFFSPKLYQVAEADKGTSFHDISDHSTNGYYPAVTGLDDATGWGSPNVANLLNAMVKSK